MMRVHKPGLLSRVLLILALITAVTGIPAEASAEDKTSSTFGQRFDEFDQNLNGGRGYSRTDNTDGYLAWSQSYFMLGYMQRYRATSDTLWLDKVVDQFDVILAARDDRLGRLDHYTSTSLKGWGTKKFGKSGAGWHVFVVHTGLICLAPAEFVRMVYENPKLHANYEPAAARFQQALEESVDDAAQYWQEGPGQNEGHYIDPGLGLLPTNQMNAMGLTMLELYHVNGKVSYLDKVRKLARFFRNRLRSDNPEVYDWAYWPKKSANDDHRSEDISHAALNVDFVVRCYLAGIEFNEGDIKRLGNTWLDRIVRDKSALAATVDGKGDGSKYSPQAAGRWLVLVPVLPKELQSRFLTTVRSQFELAEKINAPSALGLSHLALYDGIVKSAPVAFERQVSRGFVGTIED